MKNLKIFSILPFLIMVIFLLFASSCEKDDDTNVDSDGYNSENNTLTDSRDGKVYKTVTIGEQIWLAENLAFAPSSGNYWAYDNDDANVGTYGYLYDWQTALNVCPTGWHLPSDAEWTELTEYLDGQAVSGGKLKATGTIEAGTGLWYAPNTGATNETGFSALPGGRRFLVSTFDAIGSFGYWWSATEVNTAWAQVQVMIYSNSHVNGSDANKELGYSVRCVRN